jgi:hypothetical protein
MTSPRDRKRDSNANPLCMCWSRLQSKSRVQVLTRSAGLGAWSDPCGRPTAWWPCYFASHDVVRNPRSCSTRRAGIRSMTPLPIQMRIEISSNTRCARVQPGRYRHHYRQAGGDQPGDSSGHWTARGGLVHCHPIGILLRRLPSLFFVVQSVSGHTMFRSCRRRVITCALHRKL